MSSTIINGRWSLHQCLFANVLTTFVKATHEIPLTTYRPIFNQISKQITTLYLLQRPVQLPYRRVMLHVRDVRT